MDLCCGVVVVVTTTVGDLGWQCWLRIPPLESMVALLFPRASSRRWQHGIRWMCVGGLFGICG
jgi:hypothetical protein